MYNIDIVNILGKGRIEFFEICYIDYIFVSNRS